MNRVAAPLALTIALIAVAQVALAAPVIIDHTCTDETLIPEQWITAAKGLRVWYGYTSHGSQIVSGMYAMKSDVFDFNEGLGSLQIEEESSDLGTGSDLAWRDTTISRLDDEYPTDIVIWSWCGGVSENTEDGIDAYLNAMSDIEKRYPHIKFVYMTGHLDGSGENGNLNLMNDRIREYCEKNGKILFDFADIESYDPDGDYFLDKGADDGCNYNGGNWAEEWCARNSCADYECAHSHPLNCDLKARAFWWMMARLAGWGGPQDSSLPGEETLSTGNIPSDEGPSTPSGGPEPAPVITKLPQQEEPSKYSSSKPAGQADNTLLYTVVGVTAAVILGLFFYMRAPKKS